MPRAAWVYLTQNTRSDASYGVDRVGPLERSLESLYKYSVARHPYPVLIFHEGDFRKPDQHYFCSRFPGLEFREIQFDLPDFLAAETITGRWGGKFSLGYRHMCRFYSYLLYPLLWDEFDFYARLDDDSFLLSPIEYDLFAMMQSEQLDYVYRVDCQDHINVSLGFSEVARGYLLAESIQPGWLWQRNVEQVKLPKSLRNSPLTKYEKYLAGEWNRWGYYNNFHATRLSFWHRDDVQAFLRFLDRTGGNYKYRWNDLITQSAAVQIFGDPSRVRKLVDWDYSHRTTDREGRLRWGGTYCRDPNKSEHCVNTRG